MKWHKVTFTPQLNREGGPEQPDNWSELRAETKEKVEQLSHGGGMKSLPPPQEKGQPLQIEAVSDAEAAKRQQAWDELKVEAKKQVKALNTGRKDFAKLRHPGGQVCNLTGRAQEIAINLAQIARFPLFKADEEVPELRRIANFTVDLLAEVVHRPVETEVERFVELLITMDDFVNDKSSIQLKVRLDEYLKLPSILSARYPQCQIFNAAAFLEDLSKKYKLLHEGKLGCIKHTYGFGG